MKASIVNLILTLIGSELKKTWRAEPTASAGDTWLGVMSEGDSQHAQGFLKKSCVIKKNTYIFEHCLLLLSTAQEWVLHFTDGVAFC